MSLKIKKNFVMNKICNPLKGLYVVMKFANV